MSGPLSAFARLRDWGTGENGAESLHIQELVVVQVVLKGLRIHLHVGVKESLEAS